jgi:hypothetical protein
VLTGFLDKDGHAQGRPVGVVIDKTGRLLVADDVGNRRLAREGLELERVAAGIAEEHRRLLAHLPLEADMRSDTEIGCRPPSTRAASASQSSHRQHHAEMRHRHVMAVDRIADRDRLRAGIEMRDDLVAEQVEIDPASALRPSGQPSTSP